MLESLNRNHRVVFTGAGDGYSLQAYGRPAASQDQQGVRRRAGQRPRSTPTTSAALTVPAVTRSAARAGTAAWSGLGFWWSWAAWAWCSPASGPKPTASVAWRGWWMMPRWSGSAESLSWLGRQPSP